MIKRIDHIAIAVRNIDESLELLEKLFGLEAAHIEDVPDQGVKAALIPVGDCEVELLEPIDPKGGVAKFLERNGEGIHHLCFETDNTDEELKGLEGKGARLLDKQGRKGLAGRVGFVHPKSFKGVLIELAQKV